MSDDIRIVNAPLVIEYEECGKRYDEFKKEYDSLSEYEEDSIGQWLKLAKAKGDTRDSDEVLLTLMVELHRKIDMLTSLVKNEEKEYLKLKNLQRIEGIGYEHFKLESGVLSKGMEYYGRIAMPVFPKREIPLFFKAVDKDMAEVTLMHEKDTKDWSAYVVARERVMIRELKKRKNSV
jgi:hypothetical protein